MTASFHDLAKVELNEAAQSTRPKVLVSGQPSSPRPNTQSPRSSNTQSRVLSSFAQSGAGFCVGSRMV